MQSLYRTAALLSALDDAKVFQVLAFLQKKAQEPKRHIGMKSFWWSIQFICVFTRCLWNIFMTIICRNDELSSMMSWVGCLLTDSGLPDTRELREWE